MVEQNRHAVAFRLLWDYIEFNENTRAEIKWNFDDNILVFFLFSFNGVLFIK